MASTRACSSSIDGRWTTGRHARRREPRRGAVARSLSAWTKEIDREASSFGSDLIVEYVAPDAPSRAFAGATLLIREDAPDAVLSERRDGEGESAGAGGVFDAFALLPATVDARANEGSMMIGILGFGAGTCARTLLRHHSSVRMVGWELDPAIVRLARRHFGVEELERSGALTVETGDAFAMCAASARAFDGLIVDCFDENSTVVACLKDRETWAALAKKLKPGGRIIANVSTGRGRGARLEDAVACSQALADATSNEITLWRAGACGLWNELALSGPQVDWRRVRASHPSLASLTNDWFYFSAPRDAAPGSPWLSRELGIE